MTSQANTEVREILTHVWTFDTESERDMKLLDEAEQAILTWHTQRVKEIIGEDETPSPTAIRGEIWSAARNDLRAEQRKRGGL